MLGISDFEYYRLVFLLCLFLLARMFVYIKIGRHGWESLMPVYNKFVLFKTLYGSGWLSLTLFIPVIGVYYAFKCNVDLARKFNLSVFYGVGLTLLPIAFYLVLGFGPVFCDLNE